MIKWNGTRHRGTGRVRKLSAGARHGFTLIEILIVVVILGILSAIIIPQFSNATEQAEETLPSTSFIAKDFPRTSEG